MTPWICWVAVLNLSLLLTACGDEQHPLTSIAPLAIEGGDECHLCGMIIREFPGPKGEAIETRHGRVAKFCSTRDMLSWWLQPEHQSLAAQLYVHDMARSDWQHPDDRHLIDATKAFYVAGSRLRGAMGPTLASFAGRGSAESFAREHGGTVLRFDQINLEVLQQLSLH
ncbi:MAG: nitrous oxide reductase accessory protein NosL [Hahellaceae bacterium]|nr:nitrous oxide reductase accessory protein NosL [Hahellaceae bacterium]